MPNFSLSTSIKLAHVPKIFLFLVHILIYFVLLSWQVTAIVYSVSYNLFYNTLVSFKGFLQRLLFMRVASWSFNESFLN
uniref:Uncharacterized protein n=1 Tax=Rhizophora mucronata TaxID=61149 RepID=A0A2P2JNT6_RHIMU